MPSGESGGGGGRHKDTHDPMHPHHKPPQPLALVLRVGGHGGLPSPPCPPPHRPHKLAWHGSTARGSQARRRDCQGWRSSGPGEGLAAPLGEGKLLAGQRHNCSEELVVLCVEVAFPYRHMW